jgi:hypothetical protein
MREFAGLAGEFRDLVRKWDLEVGDVASEKVILYLKTVLTWIEEAAVLIA